MARVAQGPIGKAASNRADQDAIKFMVFYRDNGGPQNEAVNPELAGIKEPAKRQTWIARERGRIVAHIATIERRIANRSLAKRPNLSSLYRDDLTEEEIEAMRTETDEATEAEMVAQ